MDEDVGTVAEIDAGAVRPPRLGMEAHYGDEILLAARGRLRAESLQTKSLTRSSAELRPGRSRGSRENRSAPENFSTGKQVQRRQQPLPDEPGHPRWAGRQPLGAPTTRSGKRGGRFGKARKGRRSCSSRIGRQKRRERRAGQDAQGQGRQDGLRGRAAVAAHLQAVHGVQRRASRRVGAEAATGRSAARMGRSPVTPRK